LKINLCAAIAALSLLGGCVAPTQFSVAGDDFTISKMSGACAVGNPASVLEDLRQEAVRFCAGRKEVPKETDTKEVLGIPAVRCASAALTFQCKAKP